MSRISFGLVVAALVAGGCARWETEEDSLSGFGPDEPSSGTRDSGLIPMDEGPPPPLPSSLEGPSITAGDPPPPISGGTLLALRNGEHLVVADPDRDRVLVVSMIERTVVSTIVLDAGDEPGRSIEDAEGRVHVVLRRAGAVVSFHPADPSTAARRSVCGMPRGIAFEEATGLLHVACRGGELVSLPAAGGDPVRRLRVEPDLRDVAVTASGIVVSTFRSAELLGLDADGNVTSRTEPHFVEGLPFERSVELPRFEPEVAWRMAPLPSGGFVMAHQRATSAQVQIEPGGYGGFDMCRGGGIVQSAVTLFQADGTPLPSPSLSFAVLPVDVAVYEPRDRVALASASHNEAFRGNVFVYGRALLAEGADPCGFPFEEHFVEGEAVAVAFDATGGLWVQSRQPATVTNIETGIRIELGGEDVTDTGHRIFHMASDGFIACASCHAEGGDDGRVWTFAGLGPRRTQTMEGGILGTEPFHWSGDMSDLDMLVHEVFTGRMSGPSLRTDHVEALGAWMDSIPAPTASPPRDPAAVTRGEALFQDSTVACASCHAGPLFSNNTTVDVGTGEPFQVPRLLGIALRAPYLHTGCAPTLRDRFGTCGGGDDHGVTSHLTPTQIDDLVAYLETL